MSEGMYSSLGSHSELEAPGLVSAGNLKANFRGEKVMTKAISPLSLTGVVATPSEWPSVNGLQMVVTPKKLETLGGV